MKKLTPPESYLGKHKKLIKQPAKPRGFLDKIRTLINEAVTPFDKLFK